MCFYRDVIGVCTSPYQSPRSLHDFNLTPDLECGRISPISYFARVYKIIRISLFTTVDRKAECSVGSSIQFF